MSTAQNQRYKERLAERLRGAGAHRVQNVGFTLQLGDVPAPAAAGAPPAARSRSSPRLPPPPRESPRTNGTERQRLKPRSPPPPPVKTPTPQPPPPPASPPPPPSSPPIPPAELEIPETQLPQPTPPSASSTRQTRASAAPRVRRSAEPVLTPVARGKRTRQPSPDKALDTPERGEVEAARRRRERGLEGKRRRVEEEVEEAGKGATKVLETRPERPRRGGKRMQVGISEEEEREAEEAERRAVAAAQREEVQEEEVEESEEEYQASPEPVVRPKKPKPSSRPAKAPDEPRARSRGTGIPITVYRLAPDPASDAPELPPQSSVNPVDIILSLFTELIEKFASKLTGATEKKAVERFRAELELRLLELTSELEAAMAATKMARQKKREKQSVLDQLMEVRAQRKELALEMERVRERHKAGLRENEKRAHLAEVWEDLALQIERAALAAAAEKRPDEDEPDVEEGLGSMALAMAEAVAGKEDGRLAQMVAFNRFLREMEAAVRESNERNA